MTTLVQELSGCVEGYPIMYWVRIAAIPQWSYHEADVPVPSGPDIHGWD